MQSGQVDTIKTQNDWWKYLMGSSGQSAYEVQPPPMRMLRSQLIFFYGNHSEAM
jgi:hypothetical protein